MKNRTVVMIMLSIFFFLIFQQSDVLPRQKEIIIPEVIIPTTQEITLPLLIPPLKNYKISSGVGARKLFEEYKLHEGYDLIAAKGSRIYAIADGEVVLCYPPPGTPVPGKRGVFYKGHPLYGGLLVIKHAYGIYSVYGHLSATWYAGKTSVKQGDPIGIIGNTGESYGEHLHFELIFDPGVLLRLEPYYEGEEIVLGGTVYQEEGKKK